MSSLNPIASDIVTLLAVINPQSATTAKSTGWLPANTHVSYFATVLVGAITSTGTDDIKLEQATDSSGTGVKNIPLSLATQLTDVDGNKQVVINLRPAHLDLDNAFAYFRLTITPATAASLVCAIVQGLGAHYGPGTNITTVDEVVTVPAP